MSRLSNRLSRLFAPRACLGLSLGRDSVSAAKLMMNADGAHVEWVAEERLPVRLFNDSPLSETRTALAQAFTKLCIEVRTTYLPVQVALPDPAVSALVFELDELPAETQAREQLARWRFAKALHLDAQAIACTTQHLGEDRGKALLLALAIEQSWLSCVRDALRDAGVTPAVIDTAVCHRFNRFYSVLTAKQRDGALVSIDNEAWTLSIWDSAGRLRFIRARWRERSPALRDIAEDVERALRAYARPGSGKSLGSIFISGEKDDAVALTAMLDEISQEPCVCLSVDGGWTLPEKSRDLFSFDAALAAACSR